MESSHTINGYKVVLIPVKSNIIYVQSFILSGFITENKKNSGISHLLEHILMDSWIKCKDNCAQYWGNKGIITNASTNNTTINYYCKGLYQHRKEILEYIVGITTKTKIRTQRISSEKKAVKEELIREMNDPDWKLGFELNKFYYNHLAGLENAQNIPLQIKNLKHLGKKELENYCNKIYTPANTLFVIAGKFNKTDIISNLKSILPEKKYKDSANMIFNFSKSIERKILFIPNTHSKATEIIVSFFSPNIYPWNKECALFKIITDILSDGMNSLFMNRLRRQLHLIYNIQVYIDSDITGTLTRIETTGDTQNTHIILQEIYKVLKDFLAGDFSDGQRERVKDIYIIKEDTNCKHTTFWGDFYGSQYINQLHRKSPKIYKYDEWTKIIYKATKQNIIKAAKKLFITSKSLTIYQGPMEM